ncbi:MAG: hypothetical protein JRI44_11400 [Deltaproteobacteria bacterium]|nr:hypothetical protein [Deltaproteobacteria bacterium]
MEKDEVICPVCDASIPLEGDEKPDDEIYCSYCGMPLRLIKKDGELIASDDVEEF